MPYIPKPPSGSGGVDEGFVNDAVAASLVTANLYSDDVTGSEVSNTTVTTGDSDTLTAANLYTDTAVGGLADSTYVDTQDTNILASAHVYTDNAVTTAETNAIDYVDDRIQSTYLYYLNDQPSGTYVSLPEIPCGGGDEFEFDFVAPSGSYNGPDAIMIDSDSLINRIRINNGTWHILGNSPDVYLDGNLVADNDPLPTDGLEHHVRCVAFFGDNLTRVGADANGLNTIEFPIYNLTISSTAAGELSYPLKEGRNETVAVEVNAGNHNGTYIGYDNANWVEEISILLEADKDVIIRHTSGNEYDLTIGPVGTVSMYNPQSRKATPVNAEDLTRKDYVDTAETDAVATAAAYSDGLASNYATAAQGALADSSIQSLAGYATEGYADGGDTSTLSSANDYADALHTEYIESKVKNDSGILLTKGTMVYVSGGGDKKPKVKVADSTLPATLPAFGMIKEDIAIGGDGLAIISGLLENINTGGFIAGDEVFLGTSGSITAAVPFDLSQAQSLGKILYSDAAEGIGVLDLTSTTISKAYSDSLATDYATAAQGALADTAIQPEDELPVFAEVKNATGGPLLKGKAVYITGEFGSSGKPTIDYADSSDPAKMPAIGVLPHDLLDEEEGYVTVSGQIHDLNTDLLAIQQNLYVNGSGDLTQTKPTGTDLIQNVGLVSRSHDSAGSILIVGAGRSNDVPNIPENNIWVGNATGVATATLLDKSAITDFSDGDYATAAQGTLADSSIQSLAGYATETYADTAETDAVATANAYSDGLASNYATAAQGTTADSALQPADITPATLAAMDWSGLPAVDPVDAGKLWNNNGVLSISAGV